MSLEITGTGEKFRITARGNPTIEGTFCAESVTDETDGVCVSRRVLVTIEVSGMTFRVELPAEDAHRFGSALIGAAEPD